ncbi:hypothetical protein ACI8AC_07510 [Geodermatophilus sp. SYSU D00758]
MPDALGSTGSARPEPLWRSLVRPTTWTLGGLYVTVALIGAAHLGPLVLLVTTPGTGLLGLLFARAAHETTRATTSGPLTRFLPAAVVGALFVPFFAGVGQLGTLGARLFLVMVGLSAALSAVWAHDVWSSTAPSGSADPRPRPPSRPRDPQAETAPPRELLRVLPLDDLFAEWRSSAWQRRPSWDHPGHAAARWQEALLAEFRQRDPRGFDDWLRDGRRRGPEHHIQGRPDGPPTSRTDHPRSR